MVTDGAVKIRSRRVGYEIERKLWELVDGASYRSHQHPAWALTPSILPSLGSATAKEAFFSSLSESSSVESRGVTLPSTSAAVCSRAFHSQRAVAYNDVESVPVDALSNLWKSLSFKLFVTKGELTYRLRWASLSCSC